MVLLLMAIGVNTSQMLMREVAAPYYVVLPTPTSQVSQGGEYLSDKSSVLDEAPVQGTPGASSPSGHPHFAPASGRADLHTYDPLDLRRPAAKRDAWIRILHEERIEQDRRASGF